MKNVKMDIVGDELVIRINLKENHGLSTSGKSVTIASTMGSHALGIDGIKVGVNVYKPVPEQVSE